MNIFLTGASGFAGKNLVPYLLDRECRLTCLLRVPERLPEELRSRVTVVVGDLTHLGPEVLPALATAEAVVHLAGQLWGRTYEEFDRVNRLGTEALVEAIAQADAPLRRFVLLSSLAAAGPARIGQPLTETSPAAPISWYGQTKLAGERALAGAAFPWTVLRPPIVYGPYDRGGFRFYRWAARHTRLLVHGGRLELSLIHAKDVCQAVWLALTRESRQSSTYFLNDSQPIHQLRAIIAQVARAVGTWTVPVPIPAGLVRVAEGTLAVVQHLGGGGTFLNPDKLRELRQQAWTCDASLITANLGFEATVPLAQGISETAAWYRAKGWL